MTVDYESAKILIEKIADQLQRFEQEKSSSERNILQKIAQLHEIHRSWKEKVKTIEESFHSMMISESSVHSSPVKKEEQNSLIQDLTGKFEEHGRSWTEESEPTLNISVSKSTEQIKEKFNSARSSVRDVMSARYEFFSAKLSKEQEISDLKKQIESLK